MNVHTFKTTLIKSSSVTVLKKVETTIAKKKNVCYIKSNPMDICSIAYDRVKGALENKHKGMMVI